MLTITKIKHYLMNKYLPITSTMANLLIWALLEQELMDISAAKIKLIDKKSPR
jgi:hypothetical protein